VLDRVAELGLADEAAIAAARAEVPEVHPPRTTADYVMDHIRRWLTEVHDLDPHRLFHGGLRIETTVDPDLQRRAVAAVAEHLPAPTDPAAAVVVLDPRTGAVRAVVGGRDWSSSQVNLALGQLGSGTGRQAGSAFTPFVLAAAFDRGLSPLDVVPAPEEHVPEGYEDPVRNFDRRARPSGRRQDRDVRQPRRRLVRRLHPAADGRRLGRVPRGEHPDARHRRRQPGHRRLDPRPHLA
jgi:membrane peptidoglycan carboxypeptidase